LPPTCASDQAPLVGCPDTSATPPKPTATQKRADGHETPVSDPALVGGASFHDEPGPAGFFEVITSPRSSTATHNPILGHEAAVRRAGAPWLSTDTG
jgi:hypothetical protein